MQLSRFRSVILFLVVASVCCAFSSRAAAQLKAEPASLDLGRHKQDQTARGEVTLTNIGAEPVEILNVTADCSCTAGDPEKKKLAPGESTRFSIAVETRTYEGELKRRVHIETSKGMVMIPVKTTVTAYTNWIFSPMTVVMPASLKGKEISTEMTVTYTGTDPVELKNWTANPPVVKANVTGRKGNTFTVTITKPAETPAGNHSFRLTCETTDATDKALNLNGFLPVNSNVGINPTPIILPPTKPGQATSVPVKITGWEGEAAPHFYLHNGEVKIAARDGGHLMLQLTVTPPEAGTFTQILQIFAGERLEIEVPVMVRAQP